MKIHIYIKFQTEGYEVMLTALLYFDAPLLTHFMIKYIYLNGRSKDHVNLS